MSLCAVCRSYTIPHSETNQKYWCDFITRNGLLTLLMQMIAGLALLIVPAISLGIRSFGKYLRELSHKTQAAAALAASIAEVWFWPHMTWWKIVGQLYALFTTLGQQLVSGDSLFTFLSHLVHSMFVGVLWCSENRAIFCKWGVWTITICFKSGWHTEVGAQTSCMFLALKVRNSLSSTCGLGILL